MSTENPLLVVSAPAAEDLSADRYKFVVLTSTGVRRPDNETEAVFGILQNAPTSGQAASIMIHGISKLRAAAALAVNTFVGPEYVSATDAGKGETKAAALAYARAVVVEASGAEDDICSVLLSNQVPGITQTGWFMTTETSDATAGARTYTAAELLGGLILRDCAGASRSDVTPTAAAIVAGWAGGIVGSSVEFTISNDSDAAETITLTAGAGVTLSKTMTIAQNNSKRFLCWLTNVGAGTEAVSIRSLGTAVH